MAKRGRKTVDVIAIINEVKASKEKTNKLIGGLGSLILQYKALESIQIQIKDLVDDLKEETGLPKGFITKTAKAVMKHHVNSTLDEAEALFEVSKLAGVEATERAEEADADDTPEEPFVPEDESF